MTLKIAVVSLFKPNNYLIKPELIYTCVSTEACHSAHKSHLQPTDYLLWGGPFLFIVHETLLRLLVSTHSFPAIKYQSNTFPLEWTNFRSLNDFSLSSINFYCGQPQGVSCIRRLWCQKSTDMEHVWEKLVFQMWKLSLDPAGVCFSS